MKSWIVIAALAVLGGLPIQALASLTEAEAAYRRGATLERSGDCEAALVEYQAALGHYPHYFYAHRQIGNCYIHLRQSARALEAYDRYLMARPTDTVVADYAQRLRQSLGASAPSPGVQGVNGGGGGGSRADAGRQDPGFYAGLGLGLVMLGVEDINAFVPDGSTKATAPMGLAYGIEGGWRHASGFYVQGAWFSGLAKTHSWKEDSDITEVSVKQSMSGFYLAPGFRSRLPIKLPISVGGHLGVGLASLAFEHKSKTTLGPSSSESTTSVNAGPMLVLAEARADYAVTPQLSLNLGLGYQSAELTKIEGSNGTLKNAKGGDAKADFKGMRFGAGATWSF
jgi:tetratricopeptide (TPR) repeat protein